jgi:DNA replication protein DnaC
LVNELAEAADDKQLGKTIARYGRVDLLEIDELGYLELDRRGAECSSRFSRSVRRRAVSRSPPTRLSPAGAGHSPIHGSAWRSWTGSPSTPP